MRHKQNIINAGLSSCAIIHFLLFWFCCCWNFRWSKWTLVALMSILEYGIFVCWNIFTISSMGRTNLVGVIGPECVLKPNLSCSTYQVWVKHHQGPMTHTRFFWSTTILIYKRYRMSIKTIHFAFLMLRKSETCIILQLSSLKKRNSDCRSF